MVRTPQKQKVRIISPLHPFIMTATYLNDLILLFLVIPWLMVQLKLLRTMLSTCPTSHKGAEPTHGPRARTSSSQGFSQSSDGCSNQFLHSRYEQNSSLRCILDVTAADSQSLTIPWTGFPDQAPSHGPYSSTRSAKTTSS
jgi:hypothetical protein